MICWSLIDIQFEYFNVLLVADIQSEIIFTFMRVFDGFLLKGFFFGYFVCEFKLCYLIIPSYKTKKNRCLCKVLVLICF